MRYIIGGIVVALVSSVWKMCMIRGEPLMHVIPNILFFTPFYRYASQLYQNPEDILPETQEHIQIPIIHAVDYSYELMARVTENFRKPVIIKGLFQNTTAVTHWADSKYLANKMGDMEVAVHTNLLKKTAGINTNHDDIKILPSDEVVEDIVTNDESNYRFIFPQLAFNEFQATDPVRLAEKTRQLMDELELTRIRPGWGNRFHYNLIGQQIFIGRGLDREDAYKGIGWHTEPGNNWFIQVAGKKRWYLMEPRHSPLMLPTKRTARLVITSDVEKMTRLHDRMPILYGDVEAGDLIFNPEWYWHKTKLYPGITISVPMRELFFLRNLRSSPFYSMQLLFNLPFEMQSAGFIGRFLKKAFRMS